MKYEYLITILISLTTSSLVSVITSSLLTQWLIGRRERSQILFSKFVDQILELEKVTGYLAEEVTGHSDLKAKADEIRDRFVSLETMCGTFRRYPAVLQSIRDFNRSASWLNTRKDVFETADEYKNAASDVVDKHKKLLAACGNVLGRKV